MEIFRMIPSAVRPILGITPMDSLACGKCDSRLVKGKLQCTCGEEEHMIAWTWDETVSLNNSMITNGGREVLFHPVYSSGTAVVRGAEIFKKNHQYYFEVKILTCLYGTDIMIGVGTPDIHLAEYESRFCSMLGSNGQSWGYSYLGIIQHDFLTRKYGHQYGLGSLVGVHLDMCKGTLEYYLDRKPLGVAFTGLQNYELYPMVCSTAAQSSIRLSCSIVFKPNLQYYCLQEVNKSPDARGMFDRIPGLLKLVRRDLFWLIPPCEVLAKDDILELEDEAVIPVIKQTNLYLNKWGRYITRPDEASSSKSNDCECVKVLKKRKTLTSKRYLKLLNFLKIDSKQKAICACCHAPYTCLCANAEEEVDIYSDLPQFETSDEDRYCLKCNFKLGTHEVSRSDYLCSLCDVII